MSVRVRTASVLLLDRLVVFVVGVFSEALVYSSSITYVAQVRQTHQYLLFTSWPSVWVSCGDKGRQP